MEMKRLLNAERWKKRILFVIPLSILATTALCQTAATYCYDGKRSDYGTEWHKAKMCLMGNGDFVFSGEWRLGEWNVYGNWQIRDDSILVLNTHPQKTRFMVHEEQVSHKQKLGKYRNYAYFMVLDDSLKLAPCYLYTISTTGDTLMQHSPIGGFIADNDFVSFFLERGVVRSPTYKRKSSRSNDFLILFSGDFIFENEEWKYNKNYLIPLPRLGKNCDYRLKRVTDE